ncbi:Signal transduction histidine kinase [Micromonospora citrea]|uniref:histidine kinase n=1 Tax=Micromonospora citrea TaxID=47855 RepID=A0A1C6W1D5_9ACTN|nr:histidine kinase [Micromonospora citrea]SCL72297.1 Signal transduction histidine kinase [Micromonospora citrea]
METARTHPPRATRIPAGVALGIVSAVVEALFLVVSAVAVAGAAPAAPARWRVRATIRRYASTLARWERDRLAQFHGVEVPPGAPPRREVAYLAARLLPGALGLLAYGVLAFGVVLAAIVVRAVLRGDLGVADALLQVVIGTALLLVNVQAVASVATLDARLARRLLGPNERTLLEERVRELAASRAGVIAAVDAERQRIERDLHDGLQQRLVALGMLLGRARRSRDAERTAALLAQAHADAQQAVAELREVAWRVYPSALDGADLGQVLEMVAQRSDVPVRVRCDLPVRPQRQVETVLYFVACEALTNAAKHAAATLITVEIGTGEGHIRMAVHDDGVGGADPAGTGLSGLARRVAALDGRLRVDSPAGGPTRVSVELPCG